MKLHIVRSPADRQGRDLLEQNFRLRHRIFVEMAGWSALRRADARDVDANGLLGGSAVHASAEKGAALCDHIIDHTAQLIAHLMEHSPRVPGFPFRQRTEHSNE